MCRAKFVLSPLQRRAPAVAPGVAAQLVGITPVAFGGAALGQGQGRFRGQAALFGRLLAQLDRLGGFLEQQRGNRRRAAFVADGLHQHGADG